MEEEKKEDYFTLENSKQNIELMILANELFKGSRQLTDIEAKCLEEAFEDSLDDEPLFDWMD